MALVISISYSMNYTNSTNPTNTTSGNLDNTLRLGLAPGSSWHVAFSSTTTAEPNSIIVSNEDVDTPTKHLSQLEYKQGLRAGEQAMKDRLSADIIATKFPLPPSSPEARHRHAVNTCSNVSTLALAAIGEIAATRMIERMR